MLAGQRWMSVVVCWFRSWFASLLDVQIVCGIHDFFDTYQLSIIAGNVIHFVLSAPELDRLL